MRHVSYTIPGVVDENGDPIVFGGFVMPGHALPAQTMIENAPVTTPETAEIVVQRDVDNITGGVE